MTDQKPAGNYRYRILALLFAATSINYFDRSLMGVMSPELIEWFGWTNQDYSNILVAFQIAYAIGLLSISLFGFNTFKDLKQMKQSEITFHFIPKGSGISIIQSKNATFLCDSITAFNPRAYGFHLKNYYDARGVNFHETIHPSLNSEMLEFDVSGKKYLWIRKYNRSRIKQPFDKVMISNNAVVDLNKTFATFPGEIILDDTNSKRRILNLQTQADSLGIPLISLYETGGVICKY